MAAARALRGLRVTLIAHEHRAPRTAREGDPFDARVYALSPGNVAFLRDIGAWSALPPARLCPVRAMRIQGDDGESALSFDAYEAGVPELAWIVEDAALQDALWQGQQAVAGDIEKFDLREEGVAAILKDGRRLEARLLAGADGANSTVREAAGIAASRRSYGQSAVVANFHCAQPHEHTAWQWFQGGPVLALLPLPGNQVSMVWSLPEAEATRIAALDEAALCREVEAASRARLGALRLSAPPRRYPLQRLAARRLVAPRVALLGDAGHVVHPLAGQGLNLGLQDARVLAEILAAREPGRDAGDTRLLRRYERQRAEPILAMDAAIDGLFALFAGAHPLVHRMRNAGLNLTDRIAVLKNALIRQAMN
jgi:2-octaprenylphenol hydroxylase